VHPAVLTCAGSEIPAATLAGFLVALEEAEAIQRGGDHDTAEGAQAGGLRGDGLDH